MRTSPIQYERVSCSTTSQFSFSIFHLFILLSVSPLHHHLFFLLTSFQHSNPFIPNISFLYQHFLFFSLLFIAPSELFVHTSQFWADLCESLSWLEFQNTVMISRCRLCKQSTEKPTWIISHRIPLPTQRGQKEFDTTQPHCWPLIHQPLQYRPSKHFPGCLCLSHSSELYFERKNLERFFKSLNSPIPISFFFQTKWRLQTIVVGLPDA